LGRGAIVLISAWGQLNRWQLPDIPGRDSFQGTAFHSSEWRHDVALQGKRVACIGSGASAIQIIPEVARQARHLTIFQRSAPYVLPRMDRTYTPEERELFASDSNAFWADREAIYTACEARFDAMRPDSPKWQEGMAMSRVHLEAQVSDLILREKLWPDYPLGCKRVLFSDEFYPAMTLPYVKLETARITSIEPLGIRTAEGRLHQFDVVISATGFETLSFLSAMDIKGRDGRSLREEWHDSASAYYGMAVAGVPNFFMICGPNTFVGHNSVIAMLECQFDYILQALRPIRERQASALEVRRDAMQRFDYEVQRRLQGSAWAGGCTSWYKNASGRITNNWCCSVEDYKHETARLEVADFELVPAAELAFGDR
jgi:cation diffusion facilitator CzcD-associated flavoprotein CzcO